MTDQEINEKIARWCGVELELDLGELMDSEVEVYRILNFLDPIKGLGLLFKYAISKLSKDYAYVLYQDSYIGKDENFWVCEVYKNASILNENCIVYYCDEENKDPTRALVMAIVKLIEEENNGNA